MTVIQLGPCAVTQIKSAPTDGYEAVQVTFGKRKLSRVTAPQTGHFQKAEVAPGIATTGVHQTRRGRIEARTGDRAADVFKLGDQVDVSGISKGHGYAGVIKRHHFAGFPARTEPTSISAMADRSVTDLIPAACAKGLRMAGQMGNEKATMVNLRVVEILADDNAIVVSGCVPGADGGLVIVQHAAKTRRVALEAKADG